MTKSQALKRAVAKWGKNAAVQDNRRPSSEAARKEASLLLPAAREALKAATTSEERRARRKELDKILYRAMYQRYDVGYIGGVAGFSFFSVNGSGDTWEEALTKAEA